jgi:DNA-directed RNA polymerase specialized sigma24 family protein
VKGAAALCQVEGEALRRALSVAFADEALATRCVTTGFAIAHRRWRAIASLPDPMALRALPPRARVAVVLHILRGRSPDDIATALATSRPDVHTMLRDAYRSLGVIDVVLDDDVVPYAR